MWYTLAEKLSKTVTELKAEMPMAEFWEWLRVLELQHEQFEEAKRGNR